jgi:UDP-N-acetylmuramoyl-L-alanyl-D-glutamate--2,6-diaminopimelate ligase
MMLSELIGRIRVKDRLNYRDLEITGIATDSRAVVPGELFVAVAGHTQDGHDFLEQAALRGAAALVLGWQCETPLPTVIVDDTAVAAALLAKTFYGDPASRLVLAGITGTNGKTSASFLLRSIMSEAMGPSGLIGTVGFGSGDDLSASTHTTPSSVDLFRIMSEFLAHRCTSVVMEVSSHAAVQGRITGLEFDVGVFTNVSRDHLDYHGSIEGYVAAKEIFVASLTDPEREKEPGTLVFNIDDPLVREVRGRFLGRAVSYGFGPEATVRGEGLIADLDGTRFDLVCGDERIHIDLKLLATFSAYNALAAAAAAHALGIGIEAIKRGLERIGGVPGRFQVVSGGEGPKVIVDYAHTPDALERLLAFCRELGPSRITTVFGCGGDRDRGKRPIMGRIAVEMSDEVYVTDDNPRTEDPDRIVQEILVGIDRPVHVERDRRSAIRKAVGGAGDGELVVIAGKGHEDCQIVGIERIPFDDAEEAEAALSIREVEHQDRIANDS